MDSGKGSLREERKGFLAVGIGRVRSNRVRVARQLRDLEKTTHLGWMDSGAVRREGNRAGRGIVGGIAGGM